MNIFGNGGLLDKVIDGFEERKGQKEMGSDITDLVMSNDSKILLGQGEVGVGKSMAYLLPTIINEAFPIIIATSSKTLQDQLVEKDIPAVDEVLDMDLSYVSLKGINNYLCQRKYDESDVVVTTDDGTKPGEIDWEDWQDVTCTSSSCLKSNCEYYDEGCFYQKRRSKAQNADIVVVNHHLLAADIFVNKMYDTSILPDYETLVIDEIHDFEDSIISFFTGTLSSKVVKELITKLVKATKEINPKEYDNAENLGHELDYLITQAKEIDWKGLEDRINKIAKKHEDELIKQSYGDLGKWIEPIEKLIGEISITHGIKNGKEEVPLALSQFNRHFEEVCDRLIALHDNPNNMAIWSETTKTGHRRLKVANIDVKGFLEGFWGRDINFILTSATIVFDHLIDRLGLPEEKVEIGEYESPFNYPEQGTMLVPKKCNPKADDFNEKSFDAIKTIINNGFDKTLLLFTSYRQMNELLPKVKYTFGNEYTILEQSNNFSKGFLLEKFQNTPKSILVAQAASFGTGVDIKGNKNLILAKLNFDSPKDPLFVAKSDVIEENGGNAFMDLSIPNVITRTKQQVGRGIRSSEDKAVIAILDGRLVKGGYKYRWARGILDEVRNDMKLYTKL